jgi:hypothetical protein
MSHQEAGCALEVHSLAHKRTNGIEGKYQYMGPNVKRRNLPNLL